MPKMLVPVLLFGSAALITFGYLYRLTKPTKDDPPCPGSDPIIGSFRYLKPPLHRLMAERFSKEDIVLIFLGPTRLYYINSYAAFKEAMVDNAEALSGRMSQKPLAKVLGDFGGIINSDGDLWKQYRRFTLQTLRDFGLGRSGAEHCISLEAAELCAEFASQSGQPVNVNFVIARSVSNVICQMVFGSRLASESIEFSKILGKFNEVTGNPNYLKYRLYTVPFLPLIDRFHWLLNLLFLLPGIRKAFSPFDYLMEFCQKQIVNHAADLDNHADCRDYIDAHLRYQNTTGAFNNKRLCIAIMDLFLAGTETTLSTLRWALLYMVANPDVAKKVRAEILQHLGPQVSVQMSDKSRLHYTMATLEEINRLASLAVNGVIHRVTSDFTVSGYRIPAESFVMYNMYHIHRDPEHFPEPDEFKPERHLDSDGHFQSCPRLITFGAGKRACLGESLARTELFIFFVSIMQRFEFHLENDEDGKKAQEMLDAILPYIGTPIRWLPEYNLVFSEL